jgi:hypothetical protein
MKSYSHNINNKNNININFMFFYNIYYEQLKGTKNGTTKI